MKIEILDDAEHDIDDAAKTFEQIRDWLGQDFIDAVQAKIMSLETKAGIHHETAEHFRAKVDRYPYGVFYKVIAEEETVQIIAVLDLRQESGLIENILGNRK